MKAGSFTLDSNIVISILRNDTAVIQRATQIGSIYVSCVVIAELYYGAFNSIDEIKSMRVLRAFAADATVVDCDEETAWHYGKIKRELKSKGFPLPENDIWIAAHAMQYKLTLVTRDAHFKHVSGLKLDAW